MVQRYVDCCLLWKSQYTTLQHVQDPQNPQPEPWSKKNAGNAGRLSVRKPDREQDGQQKTLDCIQFVVICGCLNVDSFDFANWCS